ncbi:ATP-binding protein [Lutibacter sp. B2]|nr:ATP-binding protein [Lutibacter sp. B2]
MIMKEFILYGLGKYQEVINQIIVDINNFEYEFDIRLILTEALTNAFKHGNRNDENKPIYLRCILSGNSVEFEIKNCGVEYEDVNIPEPISDENILSNSGRGLFLIKCIADHMEVKNNTLIIHKYLTSSEIT